MSKFSKVYIGSIDLPKFFIENLGIEFTYSFSIDSNNYCDLADEIMLGMRLKEGRTLYWTHIRDKQNNELIPIDFEDALRKLPIETQRLIVFNIDLFKSVPEKKNND